MCHATVKLTAAASSFALLVQILYIASCLLSSAAASPASLANISTTSQEFNAFAAGTTGDADGSLEDASSILSLVLQKDKRDQSEKHSTSQAAQALALTSSLPKVASASFTSSSSTSSKSILPHPSSSSSSSSLSSSKLHHETAFFTSPNDQLNHLTNPQYPYSNSIHNNVPDPPARPYVNWNTDSFKPYFDPLPGDTNVTAQLGKSTFLRCRIKQITDEPVSWVRQRDLQIIASGQYIYTTDVRFKSMHVDRSEDWYLQIEDVQKEDAGTYECQVSTDADMSLSFVLNVIEAKSEIIGGPSQSVKSGSNIALTCVINQTASPPLFIYWYKNQKVIDFGGSPDSGSVAASGGRVSVSTEKGPTTVSILRITEVTPEDAGNYSCTPIPTYADIANVTLNVLKASSHGEGSPAAIQRNDRSPLTSNAALIIAVNLLLQPFTSR